ncbi:MAG TPA: c-type cytochrome [Steroidobacteraceae bacterium]|nr:c-type cytochrome [Steroidobacteraceae bacterium]
MKKVLKWLGFVVAGLAVVLCIAVAWVFFASERALNREHEAVAETVAPLSLDPAARTIEIAEGKRLARIVGCTHCHGETLTGDAPLDIPNVARFVAPNVTQIAPHYDDAQLATLIRRGIRRDGKGTLFMPSEMLVHLSDADLAKIIAYVRTVPQSDGITEQTQVRPLGRMIVAMGDFQTGPEAAAPFKSADILVDPADAVSRGRYLVMNACSECHGQDLGGREVAHSPPLTIAKTYSEADFAKLMRDGIALGGRRTELMSPTAVARFSALTPDEVSAMYQFLQARS